MVARFARYSSKISSNYTLKELHSKRKRDEGRLILRSNVLESEFNACITYSFERRGGQIQEPSREANSPSQSPTLPSLQKNLFYLCSLVMLRAKYRKDPG